jgi:Flp pilus assembly protein TadG
MLVFLPVVVGIMDFGQFLYLNQSLWDRARAAARFGATETFTDSTRIVNYCIYNDPTGAASGLSPTLPNLGADSSKDGYVTASLTAADTDGNRRIVVTITNYPFNFLMMTGSLQHRTLTDTEPYEMP